MPDEVCKAAQTDSPIDIALSRLAKEIEELGHALTGHRTRLSPVISPAEVQLPPSIGPDYPGGSDVVQTICRSCDMVSVLASSVRLMTNSLET